MQVLFGYDQEASSPSEMIRLSLVRLFSLHASAGSFACVYMCARAAFSKTIQFVACAASILPLTPPPQTPETYYRGCVRVLGNIKEITNGLR